MSRDSMLSYHFKLASLPIPNNKVALAVVRVADEQYADVIAAYYDCK